jgi:hypothetical protein
MPDTSFVCRPVGNYRFRVRSCIGGPFRYDITDHTIRAAEARTEPFREPAFATLLRGHLQIQAGGLGEAVLQPGGSCMYPIGCGMSVKLENCDSDGAAAVGADRSDRCGADRH